MPVDGSTRFGEHHVRDVVYDRDPESKIIRNRRVWKHQIKRDGRDGWEIHQGERVLYSVDDARHCPIYVHDSRTRFDGTVSLYEAAHRVRRDNATIAG